MENTASPTPSAQPAQPIHMQSRIWLEEPEPDNSFAARSAYCHGYDVYGAMLGKAGWADMVFLLFRGEAPSRTQAAVLEILAVALANPGPRDASVQAAMCGGVGGSPAASSLMAALAVGAGSLGGSREILLAMEAWAICERDPEAWKRHWPRHGNAPVSPGGATASPGNAPVSVWPAAEHPSGFDPHGVRTATPVRQVLDRLAAADSASRAAWLSANLESMEAAAGLPLAMTGAAAAAFMDLGFAPEAGEMLYLLMRLPGAAAHALEQGGYGHKRFPFYRMELQDGPETKVSHEA
jgi:citrate synthase